MGAIGLETHANAISALIAFLASIALVKAGRVSPTHKMGWYWTAASALSWSLADTAWAALALAGLDPTASGPLAYVYVLPNVFLVLALAALACTERMRWTALQFMIDAAALLLSFLGLAFFVFLKPWLSASSATFTDYATSIGSVGTDVLALTFMASFLVTVRVRSLPLSLFPFFLGDLLYACADIAYVYQDWTGQYVPNGVLDSAYMLAFTLFAVSAVLFARAPARIARAREESLSLNAIVNRTILLFLVPLILLVFHRPLPEEMLYFGAVILTHQRNNFV